MAVVPVDTSVTGYVSGSVDKQDGIYRICQRPKPYPIVHKDSGYDSATEVYPSCLDALSATSLLGLAESSKSIGLLENEHNFSAATQVRCYESSGKSIKQYELEEAGFERCISSRAPDQHDKSPHQVRIFFVTLEQDAGASFKARSSLSRQATESLIEHLGMNAQFLPDLLGRPNYWGPELYSDYKSNGALSAIELACQYPRFTIHHPGFQQRSPLSVYMKFNVLMNCTYYLIAAPHAEECVVSLRNLLDQACQQGQEARSTLIRHPMELHILLARISFEFSQGYINLFRQSMFAQLRKVDELSSQDTADRKGLADVTIELQIVSKDVNKLLTDFDVSSRNLAKTQESLVRTEDAMVGQTTISTAYRQHLQDYLQYLIGSMDKQIMWLHNYRDRKDIAMSLVFNLVTQQDAANNIEIATGMKKDSSSMNGIALLTMVFLPGTFTSTVLGAGLFSAVAKHRSINTSGIWWFWAAITFPLTGLVLLIWVSFCWRNGLLRRFRGLRGRRAAKEQVQDVEKAVSKTP